MNTVKIKAIHMPGDIILRLDPYRTGKGRCSLDTYFIVGFFPKKGMMIIRTKGTKSFEIPLWKVWNLGNKLYRESCKRKYWKKHKK